MNTTEPHILTTLQQLLEEARAGEVWIQDITATREIHELPSNDGYRHIEATGEQTWTIVLSRKPKIAA